MAGVLTGLVKINNLNDPLIYLDEDNIVTFTNVSDGLTNVAVTDGAGTFTILDEDGTAVPGMTDFPMYVSTVTANDYRGILPKEQAALLTTLGRYQVALSLSSQARKAYRRVPVSAVYHGVN